VAQQHLELELEQLFRASPPRQLHPSGGTAMGAADQDRGGDELVRARLEGEEAGVDHAVDRERPELGSGALEGRIELTQDDVVSVLHALGRRREELLALGVATLDKYLNTLHWQRYEAVATTGIGIFDTRKAISKLVISKL